MQAGISQAKGRQVKVCVGFYGLDGLVLRPYLIDYMFHGFPAKIVTRVAGKKSMIIIKNISLIFFLDQSCIVTMQVGARTHVQERALFCKQQKIRHAGSVKHEIDLVWPNRQLKQGTLFHSCTSPLGLA